MAKAASLARRVRLFGAAVVFAVLGIASKWYDGPLLQRGPLSGPLRDVVIGQFLDYFGAVSIVLGARVVFVRASMWKVAGGVLAILMTIEFSQRLHGGFIERIRDSRIGLLIVGAHFQWGDVLAYLLGAATAVWIDRRLLGAQG